MSAGAVRRPRPCYDAAMRARRTLPEPVTESEVRQAVKEALLTAFGDRHLDIEVARRALAHAAFDLIELHLREVGARPAPLKMSAGLRPLARPSVVPRANRASRR